MKCRKRDARVLQRAIRQWESEGLLVPELAARLHDSCEVIRFDWQRLAKYTFWVALACLVISISSALADKALIALLERVFSAPAAVKAAGFALAAAGAYTYAWRRRLRRPDRRYSNEAFFMLGVLATAASIGLLGEALADTAGLLVWLLLLAAVIYATLGLLLPSTLVWVFGLLSLGSWLGAETGYLSGWGVYYLGMNYPLRFVIFGGMLVGLSRLLRYWPRGRGLAHATYVVGLLDLFIALWIMSIFGNYGSIEQWYDVPQYELLHWALLFGLAAVAAIWYGLRRDDRTSVGFGLTFLFINLYTRYFEYFWDTLHKAIFFALLAWSFWWLGTHAERVWRLGAGASWFSRRKGAQTGASSTEST